MNKFVRSTRFSQQDEMILKLNEFSTLEDGNLNRFLWNR